MNGPAHQDTDPNTKARSAFKVMNANDHSKGTSLKILPCSLLIVVGVGCIEKWVVIACIMVGVD